MNDEHNSESEPMHVDASEEHAAPEHEQGAGAWSDDHPPVDDFADQSSSPEEVATVSQEAAETGEGASSSGGQSRSMLPLFGAIAVVVVLGAGGYYLFGSSSSTSQPMMAMMADQGATKGPPPQEAGNKPAPSSTPGETDVDAFYKHTSDSTAVPSAGSLPQGTRAVPTPTSTLTQETNPTSDIPAKAPPTAEPSSTMPPVAVPQTAGQMGGNVAEPAPSGGQSRIDALSARIDGLQRSLDVATKQLNQISTTMATKEASAPPQASAAVEDRLNKIEQHLNEIQQTGTQGVSLSAPSSSKNVKGEGKPASVHKRHATHAVKRTPKKAPPAASGTSKAKPAPKPQVWVLRAATPKEAWVSPSPNSPELRHVEIGDSLPGVGRVKTIRRQGAGWEIEGSEGIIH